MTAAGRSLGGNGTGHTIDGLIEQGLDRYGSGDLEGALAAWEGVLALQPDEPRARGYVEYVRANYELLTGSGDHAASELTVPFGLTSLDDDAAYDVEIAASAAATANAEVHGPGAWPRSGDTEPLDDGWFLDEDSGTTPLARALALPGDDASSPAIEMEADEPELEDEAVGGGFVDEKTRDIGGGRRLATSDFLVPMPPDLDRSADLDRIDFDRSDLTGEQTRERPGGIHGFLRPTADSTPLRPARSEADEDLAAMGRALPGLAWSSAEQSTVEIRVGLRDLAEETRDLGRAPAAPLLDAGFDLDDAGLEDAGLDEASIAAAGLDDPGDPADDPAHDRDVPADRNDLDDGIDPPTSPRPGTRGDDDDDQTIERSSWARATSEHEATRERQPMAASSGLSFDIDDDDLRGDVVPPLVIVDDPVLADASTFGRAEPPPPSRSGRPTRAPDVEPPGDDEADNDEFDAQATVDRGRAVLDLGLGMVGRADAVPVQVIARDLLLDLDRAAPGAETRDERVRRRIGGLLDRAASASSARHHSTAVIAVDLALAEDPDSAVAQKLIHRHQSEILAVYQEFVGDLHARPALAIAMHDLAAEELDSRSAFLLSRIDGALSFEEILDVAGMTRLEAFRYLARLLLRGILEVR
jgi:hypothetical protein